MGSRPDSEQTSAQQAKETLDRAASEAGHLASSAADAARRRGREGLDQVKDQTADRAEEFADVIDATADELESQQGSGTISEYGHSMAAMMRRLAGGLREKEIDEFAAQLAGFARRSPGTFLAGSVALGFGVSRFLKATSERPVDFYEDDDREDYLLEEDQGEYLFEPEGDIDTTLQPSPSPEISPYAAGDRWPEDDEVRDAPGTDSLEDNGNLRRDEHRRENPGRDHLGGTDRE